MLPGGARLRAACRGAGRLLFGGARGLHGPAGAGGPGGPGGPGSPPLPRPGGIEGVRTVIAVASGKGGVGKSTTAANLACALAAGAAGRPLRIGLLDADVFGPSVPRLMNLTQQGKPRLTPDKLMIPLVNHGVRCMSMGFLMEDDKAAVWRGPMVMGALEKLLRGTQWAPPGTPPLDLLVIDMPPGTGDAQISISQKAPLAGAVLVSTPQEVSLIDARRGAAMFRAVRVPPLGLLETMAAHACPKCGHEEPIFGTGGGARLAAELGIEFLGGIPLESIIRRTSDEGTPAVLAAPESAGARAYAAVARRVWAKLQEFEAAAAAAGGGGAGQPPRIVVE